MAGPTKYTVVRHSAFEDNQDDCFARGLEPAGLSTEKQVEAVEKAGGAVFDSYGDADDAADAWMYPPGSGGLIPQAAGRFSSQKIDGRSVYIPEEGSSV